MRDTLGVVLIWALVIGFILFMTFFVSCSVPLA